MSSLLSEARIELDEGFSRPVVGYPIVVLLVGVGVWGTITGLTAVGASTAIVFLLTVGVAGLIPLVSSYLLIKVGL